MKQKSVFFIKTQNQKLNITFLHQQREKITASATKSYPLVGLKQKIMETKFTKS